MNGIFVPFPYSGNVLSAHGNTSMADHDSMSFLAVFPDAVFKFIGNPARSSKKFELYKPCSKALGNHLQQIRNSCSKLGNSSRDFRKPDQSAGKRLSPEKLSDLEISPFSLLEERTNT
jgi:hypothetical protein